MVTACVVLPRGFSSPLIRDSKKLNDKQKKEAYYLILENAISISCSAGSVKDIDDRGINTATFNTMLKDINQVKSDLKLLDKELGCILLDGIVWLKESDVEVELVPKGDDTYLSIAAAAIVAKVRRDEYMVKLHDLHPEYVWDSNKGYLSPAHIKALKEHGATKYHRKDYIKKFI